MKTILEACFLILAGFILITLAGCASGPSTVHYGASVHYSTGWGHYDPYPPHYRPPHYRPPPPHRPPPDRPPGGRPPGGKPPGGGRPTQLPSRR